jgi:hypothetical protein
MPGNSIACLLQSGLNGWRYSDPIQQHKVINHSVVASCCHRYTCIHQFARIALAFITKRIAGLPISRGAGRSRCGRRAHTHSKAQRTFHGGEPPAGDLPLDVPPQTINFLGAGGCDRKKRLPRREHWPDLRPISSPPGCSVGSDLFPC